MARKTLREVADSTLKRELARLRHAAREGGIQGAEHAKVIRDYEREVRARGLSLPRLRLRATDPEERPRPRPFSCTPIGRLTPALVGSLPQASFALPGRRFPMPDSASARVQLAKAEAQAAVGKLDSVELRKVRRHAARVLRRCRAR